MSRELNLSILASLHFSPVLIESFDLRSSDFEPGKERAVFSAISAMWEDSRPAEIDPVLLVEKLGPDFTSFISSLMDGRVRISPEIFKARCLELKRHGVSKKIVALSKSLSDGHLRTGEFDQEELNKLYALIENDLARTLTAGPEACVPLAQIDSQPVQWLWRNYVPVGRATLLSGDPNCGKTFLALDLAARLSRGLSWPDGSPGIAPANILYLTVEDNAADTIRPRIDNLGGDPERILILNPKSDSFLSFAGKAGVRTLEDMVKKIKDVRLVCIDPILDFSGPVDPNSPEQVRALLGPLIRIAQTYNFALLLIGHLNKAQSLSALYRSSGTTGGWLGKCRAAFIIIRDIEEKRKRHFISQKSNLSQEEPDQLGFEIVDGRLLYMKEENIDPDLHLNPELREEHEKRSYARTWLSDFLKGGPQPQIDVISEGKTAGISQASLYRAKTALGIVSRSAGLSGSKKVAWELRT